MPLPHGAFPAAALRAAALGAGALFLSAVGYRLAGSAEIAADGRWDTPFFAGFSPFTPRPQPGRPRRAPGAEQLPFIRGFRVSSPEARIALRALRGDAPPDCRPGGGNRRAPVALARAPRRPSPEPPRRDGGDSGRLRHRGPCVANGGPRRGLRRRLLPSPPGFRAPSRLPVHR